MNEIIATAPWAFWTFSLGGFAGLVVLIACFARLGSWVSGVEKNLVGLRDEMLAGFAEMRVEMRAEIAEVNKNLSRLGERVAKTEGRFDGWFEASNLQGDEKPETTNSPACAPNGFLEDVPTCQAEMPEAT